MNTLRYPLYLLLAGVLAVSLTACDQSSQNVDFEPGDNLTINGPSAVTMANYDTAATGEYYVEAFTISQDYSWSVDGEAPDSMWREGEYVAENSEEPRTYTVSVATTIDGEEYTGTLTTEADYPAASVQADKRGLTILASAVDNAGLLEVLDAEDDEVLNGYTAFGPTNAAFLSALDDNDDESLSEDELPAPGVLADILRYHASPDSVTAGDLTNGQTIPTALPGEVVSVNTTGAVIVNGAATSATVTEADVATSDGVIHVVDGVLLPNSVISANDQDAARSASGDTVEVSGTFMASGGFVVLHDSTSLAEGNVAGSVVGNSFYLDPGFHKNITVITDDPLDAAPGESVTLTAMPHQDTNDTQTYDFGTIPGADGPYVTSGSGNAVVDNFTVTIPEE